MATMSMSSIYPFPLALAVYLGASGYRKGSLSANGAITASVVGYATMANPFPGFGCLLIAFYLAGSRATKYKAQVKATLETHGVESTGSSKRDTSSGNRSATQVLCNSLTAAIASLLYRWQNTAGADPLSALVPRAGYASNQVLTLVVVGHFAACLGDTLSSELGILSTSQPRLITRPGRVVPKGTNGGVTAWGTLVAALGGAAIGGITSLTLLFFRAAPMLAETHARIIALATAAGLFGSALDSLLGATLQQTLRHKPTGKILVGPKPKRNAQDWTVVSGFNVLDNNAVNFIASTATALLTAFVGTLIL